MDIKKTRKIAIIASSLHSHRQKHLLEWYEDISHENIKSQLFIGSKKKDIPSAKNYKVNSKLEKLKYRFLDLFTFKNKNLEFYKIRPLLAYNPEVIHLLTSNVFQNIESVLESGKVKLVVSFRGFDINVFPNQSEENSELTQLIFERADVLHFISEDLKNTAINLGADSRKCRVIRRSIRIDAEIDFKTGKADNQKLIILSVGRLVWEKGYIYALETIAILKDKGYDFEYHIAGAGIDFDILVFHVKRLNIQDRVRFLGELTRDEVKERLTRADIYFQASLSEALSLAIIEASYYKLPIVSSDIGGIPEVVKNNKTGFLSPSCNTEEYAKSIIKLLENRNLRIRMGNKGHNFIVDNFPRKKEIIEWKHLYKNI